MISCRNSQRTPHHLETADVEELVASPATTVFIARDDGRIVGSLTLVDLSIPTGLRAWIEDVVVDGAARGTGVGEASDECRVEESRPPTRSFNRPHDETSREAANRLYARLGFELRETNVYRFVVTEAVPKDS